jgi:DNA-directed RNA polymerase subunit beta
MSKPTNYQVRKYGPLTDRRDYSNTKTELETQDFLQMQRDSFE